MADPNFARTIVLVLHHSEHGAFGVVLNRPLGHSVKELWEKLTAKPCPSELHVNFGGPVPGPLVALHDYQPYAEIQAAPGLYLAAQREHLEQLAHQSQHAYRLFIGHAGWAAGQLEGEIARGDWMTAPASAQHVFADDSEELWKKVMREIGRSALQSVIKVKHVPPDASYN